MTRMWPVVAQCILGNPFLHCTFKCHESVCHIVDFGEDQTVPETIVGEADGHGRINIETMQNQAEDRNGATSSIFGN